MNIKSLLDVEREARKALKVLAEIRDEVKACREELEKINAERELTVELDSSKVGPPRVEVDHDYVQTFATEVSKTLQNINSFINNKK